MGELRFSAATTLDNWLFGSRVFIYDESRYLLTSFDRPIVSQVVEASEDVPFLALMLKIEMPVIRDLLSHEEIPSMPSSSA
jgi:hypothetical protein